MSLIGELRSISFQTLWGTGADLDTYPSNTQAGVRMGQSEAMALTTAYACVSLLADTMSTLPTNVFTRRGTARVPRPRPDWLYQPEAGNASSSWISHISEVMVSLLIAGNAYVYTGRDPDTGDVIDLRVLNPANVAPKVVGGTTMYELRGRGGVDLMDQYQIRHVWGVRRPGELTGLSPIDETRESLGKTLAADRFGQRFFGSGASLSGVIQAKGKMDTAKADELKEKFLLKYGGTGRSFGVAVLDQEAEWKPLAISPEQAQFLATLEKGDEDVARLFRVPPPLAGITKPGAMAFASVEALLIDYEMFTVRPYAEKLEELYRPLLPPGEYLKLNTDGIRRGDFKSRMEGYSTGINAGFYRRSDVRAWEDLPPVAGLDEALVPLNMASATAADLKARGDAMKSLTDAGIDPAEAARLLGLPAPIEKPAPVPVAALPVPQEAPNVTA